MEGLASGACINISREATRCLNSSHSSSGTLTWRTPLTGRTSCTTMGAAAEVAAVAAAAMRMKLVREGGGTSLACPPHTQEGERGGGGAVD